MAAKATIQLFQGLDCRFIPYMQHILQARQGGLEEMCPGVGVTFACIMQARMLCESETTRCIETNEKNVYACCYGFLLIQLKPALAKQNECVKPVCMHVSSSHYVMVLQSDAPW